MSRLGSCAPTSTASSTLRPAAPNRVRARPAATAPTSRRRAARPAAAAGWPDRRSCRASGRPGLARAKCGPARAAAARQSTPRGGTSPTRGPPGSGLPGRVRGESGERLAQVRMLQTRGELGPSGGAGIVGSLEQLFEVAHHGRTRLLERARVVRLQRGAEQRQLIERRVTSTGLVRRSSVVAAAICTADGHRATSGDPADVVRRRRYRKGSVRIRAASTSVPTGCWCAARAPTRAGQQPRQILPPLARHPGGPLTSASTASDTGRRARARSTSAAGACPIAQRCITASSSCRRGCNRALRRTRNQRFRMMRMISATSRTP